MVGLAALLWFLNQNLQSQLVSQENKFANSSGLQVKKCDWMTLTSKEPDSVNIFTGFQWKDIYFMGYWLLR